MDPTERVRRLEAELEAAREEIRRLTDHDALTGCLSRDGLGKAIEGLRGPSGPVGALAVDVDDFERINLHLGHATGDLVLRELAARMRGALRPQDLLARVGGNRFLALLPGVGVEEARSAAERVRLAVAWQPVAWEPTPIYLTVSAGVAELPAATIGVEEVLSIARVALDRSKRHGKNRVSSPDEASTLTRQMKPELRSFIAAVQQGEGLTMAAQQIRTLPGEGPAGWEMLVRGPPGPLASPVDLFRLAGEHHLTTPLDMLCLRLAVSSVKGSGRTGEIHLNLLPATLLEVPFERLLAELKEPPEGVTWCVELSEQQFLGDPAELVGAVGRLRQAGVHVAIDDLGSGKGTLDSVLVLEPHKAKLDIRLVRGISGDAWRRGLVERLVTMCRALGVLLVAEGIENREDLDVLVRMGVGFGQGYLWGRPEPVR